MISKKRKIEKITLDNERYEALLAGKQIEVDFIDECDIPLEVTAINKTTSESITCVVTDRHYSVCDQMTIITIVKD